MKCSPLLKRETKETHLTAAANESDPLKFLPKGSDEVVAYEVVSERLTGYYALEVIVETPDGNGPFGYGIDRDSL